MKYLTANFPRTRTALAVLACLSLAAVTLIYAKRAMAVDQEIAKLNRFVQTNKLNTAAMQTFKEGRDLIESQDWQKAAEKFNDFIKGYPKDKDMDAALYWYAYALQKQNYKEDARKPLERLIERYPGSSWRREAEALLVLMGYQNVVTNINNNDNCEIKTLALQSLFQADQERAVALVTESLKANANSCPGYLAAAVSMLGSQGGARAVPMLLEIAKSNPDLKLRLTAIKRLGEQHSEQVSDELSKLFDADRTKEVRVQILRALVEGRTQRGTAKVIDVARSGDDLAMRQYAIRYIGELRDEASLDVLISIYANDKNPDIRSQVLRALSERDDPKARAKILEIAKLGETPEIRIEAIRRLADHGRIGMDDLLQLYNSETEIKIKQSLLRAFADNNDPRGRAKILEVARTNGDLDLRKYAIRIVGDQGDEQTTDALVAMYDSEQNVDVRAVLLRAFGNSKQKSAVRKLMAIARNDPSIEQRKLAVRYLGESKDPEALKFLEDLLK